MSDYTSTAESPLTLHTDATTPSAVLAISRKEFANKQQTEDRFTLLLNEMREQREIQDRKWAEQRAEDRREWAEQRAEDKREWAEQRAEDKREWAEQRAEDKREWAEQRAKDKREWAEQRAEDRREWAEQRAEDRRKWDEQDRKWDKANIRFDNMHQSIMAMAKKYDRTIGALGARWGLQSEAAFRSALASVLEENFDIQVRNVTEWDATGEVFGRPDQIELDIVVRNGWLLLFELKSSISKSDMYAFKRKADFYQKKHQRQVNRLIVISPMVEPQARLLAKELGIEVFSDSMEVNRLESSE